MLPFGNAIKHSPKGAPIVVSVNERDLVSRRISPTSWLSSEKGLDGCDG